MPLSIQFKNDLHLSETGPSDDKQLNLVTTSAIVNK